MKTQWIYRLCDILGGGPYRGYDIDYRSVQRHYKVYDRPQPSFRGHNESNEFGYNGTHFFGFKDKATLRKWFSNKCRRGMLGNAFVHKILINVDSNVAVLEADDKRQIVFDSSAVVRAICLDVATFTKIFELTQEELKEMDYHGRRK